MVRKSDPSFRDVCMFFCLVIHLTCESVEGVVCCCVCLWRCYSFDMWISWRSCVMLCVFVKTLFIWHVNQLKELCVVVCVCEDVVGAWWMRDVYYSSVLTFSTVSCWSRRRLKIHIDARTRSMLLLNSASTACTDILTSVPRPSILKTTVQTRYCFCDKQDKTTVWARDVRNRFFILVRFWENSDSVWNEFGLVWFKNRIFS